MTAFDPNTIALHTCCGPCSTAVIDALLSEGNSLVLVYFNPNIHPEEEYQRRLAVTRDYARDRGIELIELEYQPDEWTSAIRAQIAETGSMHKRCPACYRLRIDRTAQWAKDNGIKRFATTLTVSPYQNQDELASVAATVATEYGLEYAGRDFSMLYTESVQKSRELGMYRQNYCGCTMSNNEARQARAMRKLQRQQSKDKA